MNRAISIVVATPMAQHFAKGITIKLEASYLQTTLIESTRVTC